MNRSLRQRLLLILGGSIAIAWLATAFFSYLDTKRLIEEVLDARLEQSADLLLVLLDRLPQEDLHRVSRYEPGTDADQMIAFWVHGGAGKKDSAAGSSVLPTRTWRPGFTDMIAGNDQWRVFGATDGKGLFVEVALRREVRARFADSVAAHILHPLWIAFPLLAILIWLSVRWGLSPLRAITSMVEQRGASDLQPLRMTSAPSEVRPLLDALDRLFARIASLLERERRFAADAAHELRTPLAAIKTHAQVAEQERDPGKRAEALSGVIEGADRGTRLVEQLLVLSRLDQESVADASGTVNLGEIVIDCIAEAAPRAAVGGIDLGISGAPGDRAIVTGSADLLRILVRNLLDNAVRYTPFGGDVDVAVDTGDYDIVLRVSDSGPGIPTELRNRVFDRFYRIEGSGQPGCGLGLSIVSQIAKLHGGTVGFEYPPGDRGLSVKVALPKRRAEVEGPELSRKL